MSKEMACCYCGGGLKNKKTRDHIPPKSFFTNKERKRFQAITVPSCENCNNGSNIKDEHAKHVLNLCVAQMNNATPDQVELHKKTLDKNRRIRTSLESATPNLVRDSASGIYTLERTISMQTTYVKDTEIVLQRIARGLYWYHYQKVLSADAYHVNFLAGLDLVRSAKRSRSESNKRLNCILELRDFCQKEVLVPGAFTYWISKTCDRENAAAFLMLYRKSVLVAVLAGPE